VVSAAFAVRAAGHGSLELDTCGLRSLVLAATDGGGLMSKTDVVVEVLHELVDALDRRVRHVERLGETRIAADAAALREDAVNRIRELSGGPTARERRETERSDGVMTDDGGPLRSDD
jgi:hypothetical protein